MLFEDDAFRDVAVDDVEREVENLGSEAELLMDLDQEVHEIGLHVALELGLQLHANDVGHG